MFPSFGDSFETSSTPRLSNLSDYDIGFESYQFGRRSVDTVTPLDMSYASYESDFNPSTSPPMVREHCLINLHKCENTMQAIFRPFGSSLFCLHGLSTICHGFEKNHKVCRPLQFGFLIFHYYDRGMHTA